MSDQLDVKNGGGRPRWWIAALFSYLLPGLGQAYAGEWNRGLLCFFIFSIWSGVLFALIQVILMNPLSAILVVLILVLALLTLLLQWGIILDAGRRAWLKRSHGRLLPRPLGWPLFLALLLISVGSDYYTQKAIRTHFIAPFRIPAASMTPALKVGDFFLTNQLYYCHQDPERGDIVVFRYPRDESIYYIKRIVGMPGDSLETACGRVYIDGLRLDEPYAHSAGRAEGEKRVALRVPEHEYFVLGDNRDNSSDSRLWGTVSRHQVVGKPMFIYWSWDSTLPAFRVFKRLLSIRPSRLGRIIR